MRNHQIGRLSTVSSCLGAILLVGGTALAHDHDQSGQPSQSQTSPSQSQTANQNRNPDVQPTGGQNGNTSRAMAGQEAVKDIQRELQSRNLYNGKIDGIAGAQTQQALKNFQVQQGITASGELDAETADALGLKGERQAVSGTGAATMSGVELSSLSQDDARKLQEKLQELGLYRGQVDGVIGQQTRVALQQYFQQQAQLALQGRLSDSTAESWGVSVSERQPTSGKEGSQTTARPTQPQPSK